ncbi:MAG: DUF1152 domain-containing protein [Haloarculaceae archaeon]
MADPPTLADLTAADSALVIGIGGGGDIVGAVPTARFLERHDVETWLGGLPWERPVVDPTPGPYPLDRIEGLELVSDTVGLADGETRADDGVAFAECRVADVLEERVALLDITEGPGDLAAGLETACNAMGIDCIVGVDAGGDALARGNESGIRSPIADAISVAALDATALPTAIGIFGWGSDGELTPDELDASLAEVAAADGLLGAWGLTPEVCAELDTLFEVVPTEASRLPVEAARGDLGQRRIRDGTRSLRLTAASTVTFYLATNRVARVSDPVTLVHATESLEAAHESLRAAGYITELAIERGEVD